MWAVFWYTLYTKVGYKNIPYTFILQYQHLPEPLIGWIHALMLFKSNSDTFECCNRIFPLTFFQSLWILVSVSVLQFKVQRIVHSDMFCTPVASGYLSFCCLSGWSSLAILLCPLTSTKSFHPKSCHSLDIFFRLVVSKCSSTKNHLISHSVALNFSRSSSPHPHNLFSCCNVNGWYLIS